VDHAPAVTAVADQTTPNNATINLAVDRERFGRDPLTFTAAGLPDGLTINPATGVISGSLTYASASDRRMQSW